MVLANECPLPVKILLMKKMAAQAQAFEILQIWYQIQQEEALAAVELNVEIKIARLQNIANMYMELNQLIQAVNQAPPPPAQK